MKKVKVGKFEYDLEDKDAALVEIIQELTIEIRKGRNNGG